MSRSPMRLAAGTQAMRATGRPTTRARLTGHLCYDHIRAHLTKKHGARTELLGGSFWTKARYLPDRILLGFARGMPGIRTILNALRVAALWLLVMSVIVGPVVPSVFASAGKTCGVSCPCDEAAHDDHADEHAEAEPCDDDAMDSDHDEDEPCRDECPDDCPNCGCCLGIALAVLPLPVTPSAVGCASVRMFPPSEALASGARGGVFRPPRSLT